MAVVPFTGAANPIPSSCSLVGGERKFGGGCRSSGGRRLTSSPGSHLRGLFPSQNLVGTQSPQAPSPAAPVKSFVEAVTAKKQLKAQSLGVVNKSLDIPEVIFSAQDRSASFRQILRHAIVGKFSFGKPKFQVLRSTLGVEIDRSLGESDVPKETGTKKRSRTEACATSSSKACREKLRRDKLNDGFIELAALLEPGRPPKTDKSAILADAVRMVTQLRGDAQKLKDSNSNLQDKIKELKENLEQQLKTMNAPQPSFLPGPPAMPAAFASQGQAAAGNKLVPIISYPGVAMWQFMLPAAVDTSQDHVLRPPVA
ncbi:transcription factor ilr3 [Phtheirospermum japonicum]|uniref:Transcription factor ilr3 n=1 Tax=Phtheirospermum japonicum TaxID=374723 RepID=A0A830CD06_9LAMI|nr:transcription factor ilr3 [Phtheirospermum japonicum]